MFFFRKCSLYIYKKSLFRQSYFVGSKKLLLFPFFNLTNIIVLLKFIFLCVCCELFLFKCFITYLFQARISFVPSGLRRMQLNNIFRYKTPPSKSKKKYNLYFMVYLVYWQSFWYYTYAKNLNYCTCYISTIPLHFM